MTFQKYIQILYVLHVCFSRLMLDDLFPLAVLAVLILFHELLLYQMPW